MIRTRIALAIWTLAFTLVVAGCRELEEASGAGEQSVLADVEPVQLPRYRLAHVGNPLMDFGGRSALMLSADSDMLMYDVLAQLHERSSVEMMMMGGNLIHNTGKGEADLDLFVRRMRDSRIPALAILGPRDTRGSATGQVHRGQVLAALRGHELPEGKPYYSRLLSPGLHVVVLDTTEPGLGRGGYLGRDQIAWLERALAQVPPDEAAIVFGHHVLLPFWEGSTAARFSEHVVENAEEVRAILAANRQVKMVCTSSMGAPSIREVDGIHYVSAPALAHLPCAFRIFTFEGDEILVETLGISEPKLDTLALLAVREDPQSTWRHYGFSDADAFVNFLQGAPGSWQATLRMR